MLVTITILSLLALASVIGTPKTLMRLVLVACGIPLVLEMLASGVDPAYYDWDSVYLKSATLLGVVILSIVGVYGFMMNATETVTASRTIKPSPVNAKNPPPGRGSGRPGLAWSDLRLLVYVGSPVAALYTLTLLP